MKKEIILTIITISIISLIIFFTHLILSNKNKVIEKEERNLKISEIIEDECTEEYKELTQVTTAVEEKVSANAQLILKKYFIQCEHTINEYVEIPQEIVNMTKKDVQNKYVDWEVIGFEPGKITLYREIDDICGEHFKLKIEDGKVSIYILNKDGTENIYEKTNISSEYLTETDLINMQDGLEIYGKEELNKIIEDFE